MGLDSIQATYSGQKSTAEAVIQVGLRPTLRPIEQPLGLLLIEQTALTRAAKIRSRRVQTRSRIGRARKIFPATLETRSASGEPMTKAHLALAQQAILQALVGMTR